MLESPEEDIVAKACAAIYRFSEKCKDICCLVSMLKGEINYNANASMQCVSDTGR